MNKLVSALSAQNNVTLTENGATTFRSTTSALLDWFALGGALRSRSEKDISSIFSRAFGEDRQAAVRILYYFRDIRGGQGERKTFRNCLTFLGKNHPDVARQLIKYIPEYGRWDDIFSLFGTSVERDAIKFIREQFVADLSSAAPSLLAKWMPSINTSSAESRKLAQRLAREFGYSVPLYRKTLSALRNKINVLERRLCSNEWDTVNYEGVPSKAATLYRNAFRKHDGERYQAYLDSVQKGEKTIKAATLYPYDLVHKAWRGDGDQTIDLQWAALPDYLKDNPHNGIVVADVSASMSGRPVEVCISLAIYMAERNKGAFHNKFLTFSDKCELQEIRGSTLNEKVRNLSRADWEGSTNLQSAFNTILATAIANNVPKKDMPDTIYIVSDMEFNSCVTGVTNFEAIKVKYAASGYDLPKIVFWNVNARNDQAPVKKNEKGVFLVSGCSPAILKSALNQKLVTPHDLMLEVINSDRYATIRLDGHEKNRKSVKAVSKGTKKITRVSQDYILSEARKTLAQKNRKTLKSV